MKDLLSNPDVQQLVRFWRRHSRGARIVQEHFDHDPAQALEFLNAQLRPVDLARDLAHEPPEVRREVQLYVRTRYCPTSGDC